MGWEKNINPALIFPQRLGKWGMTWMTRMISHRYRSLHRLEVGRCLFHYGDAFARCHRAVFGLRVGKVWIWQLQRRIRNPSKMARSAAGCESKSASMDANGCPKRFLWSTGTLQQVFLDIFCGSQRIFVVFLELRKGASTDEQPSLGIEPFPRAQQPQTNLNSHNSPNSRKNNKTYLKFLRFSKTKLGKLPIWNDQGFFILNYALCPPCWGTSLKTISYPRICHVRYKMVLGHVTPFPTKHETWKQKHEHKHQKPHFFFGGGSSSQPMVFFIYAFYYITLSTDLWHFLLGTLAQRQPTAISHGGLFSISDLWRESRGKCGASKEAEESWS